ncbi:hypothetical protein HY631_01480 [Candidatus Uhrbacteria bacterium]|nr:hypothetical protein [Candidatus Uhrbacteria bacterium]
MDSAFKKKLGVRHAQPTCPNLSEAVIERTTASPTVTVASVIRDGVLDTPQAVTPYHLMWRLGIRAYNHMDPMKTGDIDANFSVHSYLWAMEYYGFMTYIRRWPEGRQFAKRDGVLTKYGYRYGANVYRPEYAFVSLLSFIGWDQDEVALFVEDMNRLVPHERLPALQRIAARYLQNTRDSYAPDGFHSLCFDGGSGYNDFRLVA